MNNLKKLTALLLSVLLIVGVMAGCGSSESGESAQETVTKTSDTHTMTFGIQNYSGGGIDTAKEVNCAWNNSRYGVGECPAAAGCGSICGRCALCLMKKI